MAVGSIQVRTEQLYSENGREGSENAHARQKQNLSDDQQKQVRELKSRDLEVKAHEAAHMAAGGSCVRGGATYSWQVGPDGKRYAVGGEVSIDASSVSGDPKATIMKMQTVRRAALAPAQPSGQDRAVATQAGAVEAQAQKELTQQRMSGNGGDGTEKVAMDEKNGNTASVNHQADKTPGTETYSSNGKTRTTQQARSTISFFA
ncbi:MAG TPA: putative metalloprotease CJM1_0395 family protein [Chitinispirillaceae bacterium]|nr:putative metalloprotease CJM1_0395 family protein [Chitinispirillaceae bacterium]